VTTTPRIRIAAVIGFLNGSGLHRDQVRHWKMKYTS
jgi:hypothetical protein